jgi:DeoR/GlpR family transcriptional regulator of sugar metabolism
MPGKQRREDILRRVQREGYVSTSRISEEYGVDRSTIRRDLDALSRLGLVVRSHGGAAMRTEAAEVPYSVKVEKNVLQKHAIAQATSLLIGDGASVLIDSGSTTLEVARALRGHRGLTVITDDLRVGAELANQGDVRLIGGEVMQAVYTLVGESAVDAIRQYHVDVAILGADAIDSQGVTNSNSFEAPLKRAMIECAERVIVVADSSKFGHRALVRIASLEEIGLVITDDALSESDAREYATEIMRVPVATVARKSAWVP